MPEIRLLAQNEYPPALMEIPQSPEKLYISGTLPPPDSLFLSVVGSRKHTSYGKEACEKIIAELRGRDIIIVSGLAFGIDSLAHKAALGAGLTTVAIPGSGLDPSVLYPQANRFLAEEIVKNGGALMSEFDPDFRATPYAFPQRNRLMAGIARGVLVIEAEELSGTLITARLATEYNRDVFAVPGSIFSRNSVGTNWLLKQGAVPVTSGEDILAHWNLTDELRIMNDELRLLENCSEEEKKIIELLREPLTKDELIEKLSMSIQEVNILLSSMEIEGLIKETTGKVRINF